MIRMILIVPTIALALLFGGCASAPLTVSERSINAEQFKSAQDFSDRINEANRNQGMSKQDVFSLFNITEQSKNLERLLPQVTWETLNGNSPRMLAHDAAGNPLDFTKLEAWKYLFLNLKKSIALAPPFHFEYRERGNDQGVIFIFSDGKLYRAVPMGFAEVDRPEKEILVEPRDTLRSILR